MGIQLASRHPVKTVVTEMKDEHCQRCSITYICAHCGGFATVPLSSVEFLDSGTVLTCDKCGQDTVIDLDTPGRRAERFGFGVSAQRATDGLVTCPRCGESDSPVLCCYNCGHMWIKK